MANGFSAGDLNLSIQTVANDTIKSLDAVLERLIPIEKILGSVNRFNGSSNTYIRKSRDKSYSQKTYSVGRFGKEYLTLSKDVQKAEGRLKSITQRFDKNGKVIKKTSVELDEYGNKITKIFDTKKTNKYGLFSFAKLGVNIYLLRRMGRYVADIVQAGSDYTETLNLWQVAMRGNLDTAEQFINKMNKAYGISSKTLMNAQAIFKNMIGSLGQISEETAYKLSEALVQMSADFSSLYNVQLESAFEKMQSMLAGQVRPIRSAGLDMTETTLFMFYQQLGGTKTMRQLNRTEKQLLSILAVYKQMGSAGALGDMSKTLNQFANQSRMMTEYWAELKSWSGLILKDWLDQHEVLVYINAALITMTEIVKAIARSRGVGEDNFINGLFETTEATNEEIDELQGKLLDFDKFRSLEGAGTGELAIDEKLLEAISDYSSLIDQATNRAQILADTWLEFWLNDDGTLTEQAQILIDTIKLLGLALAGTFGSWLLLSIGKFLISPIGVASIALTGLFVLIGTIVNAWKGMESWQQVTIIIFGVVAAVTALVVAIYALSKGIPYAIGMGAVLGAGILGLGTTIALGGQEIANSFTTGQTSVSNIDTNTISNASEFGKIGTNYTPSSHTSSGNVQQMKAAELQALNEWWATAKHDIPAFQGVSDNGIYTIVESEAKRRGKQLSKV